jgi:hypothetical protein
MATWRVSKRLEKLRAQVNAAAPGRSKASEGTKGDDAHAARRSDHNPDSKGIVRALDITHDPKNGVDSEKLAEALRLSRAADFLHHHQPENRGQLRRARRGGVDLAHL